MTTLHKWRMWCEDEAAWVEWWLEEGADEPTTCPNDTAHVIDSDKTAIVTEVGDACSYDSEGFLRVSPEPRNGSLLNLISHNFCDPCTWFSTSVPVEDEALTPDANRRIFSSVNQHWIDLQHGRVSDEDDVASGYPVTVKIDGAVQTERPPFQDEGGDFWVDYEEGRVHFNEPVAEGAAVTASFHRANGSQWKLEPTSGKCLKIVGCEAQFSLDIIVNDTIVFEIFGYVEVFAPHLCTTYDPPGPYPPGTQIPIQTVRYKTMYDFVNEANGSYPTIPAIGGPSRGIRTGILELPWRYQAVKMLRSSMGMKVEVYLQNGKPCDGALGTLIFLCLSEAEQ